MGKLGGEWYNPRAPVPVPVQEARRLFWWRVETVAEEVPLSLRADVLPSFRAVLETAGPMDDPRKWNLTYFTGDLSARLERAENAIRDGGDSPSRSRIAERLRRLAALEVALRTWADRWHLTGAWCLNDALFTLRHSTRNPGADPRSFAMRATTLTTAVPPTFTFREEWGYAWTSEAAFREWAERRFREALDAFVARVNADAAAAGLEQTPERRELVKHLDMLVRWQCQHRSGWTLRRIADTYGYGELKTSDRLDKKHTGISGVKKALTSAAVTIGLERRKGKQGRR
jgi:hypothetical protein